MRKFFAIALWQCVVAATFGQLSGKVVDEKGLVLPGAVVTVNNNNNQLTDRGGVFDFADLPAKEHRLQITCVGCESFDTLVVAPAVLTITLNQSAFLLDDVIVSSLRVNEKSPVAHSKVTKEDIAAINLGQDIPFLLSMTPSFISSSEAGNGVGYTGFRIRGTDANRINVTVNGIPLNDSESHGVFWVNMPDFSSSIENIQIQRGVGASTNGAGAFGASINMQTEALNKEGYGEISSSYGSFNTNKNTLKLGTGLLKNKFAFDSRFSSLSSDGYIDRATTDMQSYYFSGGYYGKKTLVKVITFGGKEKTYHAWNGLPKDSLATNRTYNPSGEYVDNEGVTRYYDDQTDNYNQTHYQVFFSHKFSNRLNVNTALHYTRGVGYYEEYKADENLSKYNLAPIIYTVDTLTSTDLIRQKWLDNHFYGLVYSLNYTGNKLQASLGGGVNQYDGDHYGFVLWMKEAKQAISKNEFYNNRALKLDANVYAKANYAFFKGFNVYADMQYRYINHSMKGLGDKLQLLDLNPEFNFFNPKAGAHYEINKNHSMYASYAMANREPNRNNYTEAGVNEKPTSEKLSDVELGYLFKMKHFSFGLNAYYMHYDNQLVLTGKLSEIGEPLTTNIPKSKREGVELMLAYKPLKWISWEGNITFSRNRIQDYTEYVDDWDTYGQVANYLGTTSLAYSPDVTAASLLSLHFNGYRLAMQSNFVDKQYIDNTESEDRKIDSYFVSNLQLSKQFKVKQANTLVFYMTVNNIFNTMYSANAWSYSYYSGGSRSQELGYYPQAGTNVMMGLTLRF